MCLKPKRANTSNRWFLIQVIFIPLLLVLVRMRMFVGNRIKEMRKGRSMLQILNNSPLLRTIVRMTGVKLLVQADLWLKRASKICRLDTKDKLRQCQQTLGRPLTVKTRRLFSKLSVMMIKSCSTRMINQTRVTIIIKVSTVLPFTQVNTHQSSDQFYCSRSNPFKAANKKKFIDRTLQLQRWP